MRRAHARDLRVGCACGFGDPLGDPQRRRRHDVEVARVGRQVVGGALDLEEDRHLVRRALAAVRRGAVDGWSAGIAVNWTCCLSR